MVDTPIILEVEWKIYPGNKGIFGVSITSEGQTHCREMTEPEFRLFVKQSEIIIHFGGKEFFFRGKSGTITIRTKRGMVDYFKGVLRDFDARDR